MGALAKTCRLRGREKGWQPVGGSETPVGSLGITSAGFRQEGSEVGQLSSFLEAPALSEINPPRSPLFMGSAMHFRYDRFIKRVLRKLFSTMGQVSAEVEVAVDAQRIDILFSPGLPQGRPPPFDLGLLGRIAGTPCVVEVFHVPPSKDEIRDSIRKLLAWHHLQVLRARRQARAVRARARRQPQKHAAAEVASAPLPMPVLWIISSGRPEGAIAGFAFEPLGGWPSGVYSTLQTEVAVRFVVVSELPPTRDTLPLRLMGRGATAERAARELGALPREAWERRQIAPLMVTLQNRIAKAHLGGHLTEEEKELLVTGQKMIDAIEDRGWKRGKSEGRKEGLAEGLARGSELLFHQFTRKLERPLTERERATLLRRLDTLGPGRLGDVVLDLDAPALAAWLASPRAR